MIMRFQTGERCTQALNVLGTISHTVNPFIEIRIELGRVPGNVTPTNVKVVIAVVISLSIRRMATEGFVHYGVNNQTWDQGPIRVGTNNILINYIFRDHDSIA
jgi:hypothetical protein